MVDFTMLEKCFFVIFGRCCWQKNNLIFIIKICGLDKRFKNTEFIALRCIQPDIQKCTLLIFAGLGWWVNN